MQKKSHTERLGRLKKQQEIIKYRIASIEARKRKDEDRILTRKKILIGAYILELHKNSPDKMNRLITEMGKFLTRENDRKLFGML